MSSSFQIITAVSCAAFISSIADAADRRKELATSTEEGKFFAVQVPANLKGFRESMLEVAQKARDDKNYRKQNDYAKDLKPASRTTKTNLGTEPLYRQKHQLVDLVLNDKLNKAAQFQAEYNASKKTSGHDGPKEWTDPDTKKKVNMINAGDRVDYFVGTNMASAEAAAVLVNPDGSPESWLKGETHYRPFFNVGAITRSVGFGVAKDEDGKWYFVAAVDIRTAKSIPDSKYVLAGGKEYKYYLIDESGKKTSTEVPVEVAEKVLIGYSEQSSDKKTSHFASGYETFHATPNDNDVFEPKVKLRLDGTQVLLGNKFNNDGVHTNFVGAIELVKDDFYDHLVQNKDGFNDITPKKLRLKRTEVDFDAKNAKSKEIEVPVEVAETVLLGYKTDADGNKTNFFAEEWHAAEKDGVFEPKVKLQFQSGKVQQGLNFNQDGTPISLSLTPVTLETKNDFYKYVKENINGIYVDPAKLKLKKEKATTAEKTKWEAAAQKEYEKKLADYLSN